MPVDTPTLDLSAPIANRAQVIIPTTTHPQGEAFELKGELELGIVTIIKVQTLFESAQERMQNGINTVPEAEQMERWLEECFDEMFHRPVDLETRAALPDMRKMQVIEFFLDACLTPAKEQAEKNQESRRASSTGVRSSPPSKRSTAATRRAG